MTYVYDELDNYDDMMMMVMHILMMMRVSIKMMIFTCGVIDADCLRGTLSRSTNNSVLGAAIYYNGVGNGFNWVPLRFFRALMLVLLLLMLLLMLHL